MGNKLGKAWLGVAAVVACGLTGAAVAFGAGSATKTTATTTGTTSTAKPTHTPETPLTGDVAAKAKAGAVAKVGGTADSATTENDSSNANAAYEVHVTKADGTHVEVILDSSYNVLAVESHERGPDHGGPHH